MILSIAFEFHMSHLSQLFSLPSLWTKIYSLALNILVQIYFLPTRGKEALYQLMRSLKVKTSSIKIILWWTGSLTGWNQQVTCFSVLHFSEKISQHITHIIYTRRIDIRENHRSPDLGQILRLVPVADTSHGPTHIIQPYLSFQIFVDNSPHTESAWSQASAETSPTFQTQKVSSSTRMWGSFLTPR